MKAAFLLIAQDCMVIVCVVNDVMERMIGKRKDVKML